MFILIALCIREFKSLFKSIRSIIIITLLFLVTLGTAKLLDNLNSKVENFGINNDYMLGLVSLLMLVGPLFVLSLSHDIINSETSSKTMRFLVTKTSRDKIILGKFFGVTIFWFLCLLISTLLIIPFSKTFYFREFIEIFLFLSYFIGLTIFLSTIINRPRLSMFISLILAITLPIIGILGLASNEYLILNIVNFFTPYYYISKEEFISPYFILILTTLFIYLSIINIRKKDF